MSYTTLGDSVPVTTVGSVTTLDTRSRKRKHPIGFAPPKPAPKKKPATRKRKEQ